jgi:hypothetical protein
MQIAMKIQYLLKDNFIPYILTFKKEKQNSQNKSRGPHGSRLSNEVNINPPPSGKRILLNFLKNEIEASYYSTFCLLNEFQFLLSFV